VMGSFLCLPFLSLSTGDTVNIFRHAILDHFIDIYAYAYNRNV
jgi:hypothetical protein